MGRFEDAAKAEPESSDEGALQLVTVEDVTRCIEGKVKIEKGTAEA